jgi:hypothetical protein
MERSIYFSSFSPGKDPVAALNCGGHTQMSIGKNGDQP